MTNDSFTTFLSWERATRDTIDFKTIYVDIAGDLIAGLLLSQIIYWHLPSKTGESKMKSISRNGHYWIAKPYNGWYDEIRITERQAKRAMKILADKGLIETKVFKFANAPTTHTRLVTDKFIEQWNIWISTKSTNGTVQKVPMEQDETYQSIIETNLKTLINLGHAKKSVPEKPSSKKKKQEYPDPKLGWLKENLQPLGFAFLKEAGSACNAASKGEVSLWYKELNIWSKLAAEPSDVASVVKQMRSDGLRIKSPVSVTGCLRDYLARKVASIQNVYTAVNESELY